MYIIAFILMIISITKLLMLGSTTWSEIKNMDFTYPSSMIKTAILILLLDALIGLSCSLWILL